MSEALELHLSAKADLFDALRALVPYSVDRPVTVFRDGKHTVTVASLYRGACLTVAEEPSVRFVPFAPHPTTQVGPEVSDLLAADRIARAHAREAAISARKERAAA